MTGPAYDLVDDRRASSRHDPRSRKRDVAWQYDLQGNGPSDTSVQMAGIVFLPDEPTVTITYRARLLDSVENGQVDHEYGGPVLSVGPRGGSQGLSGAGDEPNPRGSATRPP